MITPSDVPLDMLYEVAGSSRVMAAERPEAPQQQAFGLKTVADCRIYRGERMFGVADLMAACTNPKAGRKSAGPVS
jgi:hypothetical protein